ncbi:MAG: pitrilysin family protein [Deltaproteobacteria bacterium]|nr:pitrilysin family protein [Deltaproteobacteria bacterium]
MTPTFVVETSTTVPLVEIVLALPVGSMSDALGREGALALALRSLRRGCEGRTSVQIDDEIDRLGAEFATGLDALQCSLHITTLTRNLEAIVALVAQMVLRPTFAEEEVARVRREMIAEQIDSRNDDRTLCGRFFRRHIFAGHPLGRPSSGTLTSLEKLSMRDVQTAWKHAWGTQGLIVGASGDVTEARLQALWGKYFAASYRPKREAPALPDEPSRIRGRHLIVVDKPARTQSQIMIGTLGTHPRDKDHHALYAANTVFGGTFTSRLTREIRSKRGWSYGASSRLGRERVRELFSMWTFPKADDAAACIKLQLKLVEKLVESGVSERELSFVQRYLARSSVFDEDTASKRLSSRLDEVTGDMPKGYHKNFVRKIEEVDLEAANQALQKRLNPEDMLICITATASEQLAKIEKAIPRLASTRVVSFDCDEFFGRWW